MGYMLRTLRKLKVKGYLSIDQLLPKQREKLPGFSATGVGVNDDLNLSGNFFQRKGSLWPRTQAFICSYQISQHFTRFFNLKKKRGYVTFFKGGLRGRGGEAHDPHLYSSFSFIYFFFPRLQQGKRRGFFAHWNPMPSRPRPADLRRPFDPGIHRGRQ